MEQIKKALYLDKTEYYETHLSLMNCIIPVKMTPMEIKVLAAFIKLEGDIAIFRFGPSARKVVMLELGISVSGLSNFITSLRNKNLLKKEGDNTAIWHLLFPEPTEQLYLFKLVKTPENEQR